MSRIDRGYVKAKEAKSSKLGAPFNVGRTVCRWHEDPESAFRFVGLAHDVARNNDRPRAIDHSGWFLRDDDYGGETATGAVYRLPHGRFIAGMADPYNTGPAALCLTETYDDEMEAARAADHIAEVYAENERDYSRASDARMRYEDLAEQAKQSRKEALALIREVKDACTAIRSHPVIADTMREKLRELRDECLSAYEKREELLSGYGRDAGWQDY